MKSTGNINSIDTNGKLVVPLNVRRLLGVDLPDKIEYFTDDNNNIMIKKFAQQCIFCKCKDNLVEYNEKYICHKCLKKISDINE